MCRYAYTCIRCLCSRYMSFTSVCEFCPIAAGSWRLIGIDLLPRFPQHAPPPTLRGVSLMELTSRCPPASAYSYPRRGRWPAPDAKALRRANSSPTPVMNMRGSFGRAWGEQRSPRTFHHGVRRQHRARAVLSRLYELLGRHVYHDVLALARGVQCGVPGGERLLPLPIIIGLQYGG